MSHSLPARPYLARAGAVELPPMSGRFVLMPPYLSGRPPISHAADQLPSIDEFLDHSPPIEQFAPEAEPLTADGDWPSWGGESGAAPDSGGGDWRGYDWGSAAKLGNAPAAADASAAWASTDWGEPGGSRESRQSAAEALARALDQIARRIRAGELRVPGPEARQDDTAIAGTLAALLGIRR